MSKIKRLALISAICLVGAIFYGWIGLSQTPQPSVQLTTNPPLTQVRPLEAEATKALGSGS